MRLCLVNRHPADTKRLANASSKTRRIAGPQEFLRSPFGSGPYGDVCALAARPPRLAHASVTPMTTVAAEAK